MKTTTRIWIGLIGLISIVAGVMLLATGCATTIDPGGAYSGRPFLLHTDQTIATSYDTINTFLLWEYTNRETLRTNAPNITAAADVFRTNSPKWFQFAFSARSNYVALLMANAPPGAVANASNTLQSTTQILATQAQTAKALH